jgi:hypothetical protein
LPAATLAAYPIHSSWPATPSPPAPAAVPNATAPEPSRDDPDRILHELLRHLGALGSPHAFAVVADDEGDSLRGHSVSDWAFMKRLDSAVGISSGAFRVALDDRANAIARACREGRVITVAWLFEVVQPALTWQESLDLERDAGGGRCTIVPLIVADRIAGAVVAGPAEKDLSATTATQLVARIEAAAEELTRLVQGDAEMSDDELRLAALRGSRPGA